MSAHSIAVVRLQLCDEIGPPGAKLAAISLLGSLGPLAGFTKMEALSEQ